MKPCLPRLLLALLLSAHEARAAPGFFRLKHRYGSSGSIVSITERESEGRIEIVLIERSNPLAPSESAGGNTLFTQVGDWVTVSRDGYVYYQGKLRFPLRTKGGNYLVDSDDRVIGIDSHGYMLDTFLRIPEPRVLGGNFIIDRDGTLVTFKDRGIRPGDGVGFATRKEGWDFGNCTRAGGNFFFTHGGSVVTVSEETGFFHEWDAVTPGEAPAMIGGNFFIGSDLRVRTVDRSGKLRILSAPLKQLPTEWGGSWMRFPEGRMVLIDSKGEPHSTWLRVRNAPGGERREDRFPEPIERESVYEVGK
jgi:hypothetical protein